VYRQIGVGDFKYAGIIFPLRIGHVIRRMRSGCKRYSQWYPMGDVRTHNSRTDSRRIFKLGGPWRGLPRDPPCMTTDQGQKVKGQGHKVT